MKCISCGSELPEGTTSCPFCGNTVLPSNHKVVISDTKMNTGVPTTPETPVLPQDQNLVAQNTSELTQGEANVGEQKEETQSNLEPNIGVQTSMEQDHIKEETVEPIEAEEMQETSISPVPDMIDSVMDAEMFNNNGELGDGMKIASTVAPVIAKKSSKKIIIIAITLIITAVVAGIGVYYYMSQYKSADKRIDAVFNGMSKFAKELKADKIESKSGTYDFGISLTYGDTGLDGKVNGNYAYDLKKKIMDYTLNISTLDLKLGGEKTNVIDQEPLKLELYTADSKAYVLLENFYEKYIYSDIEEYDELFDRISQNDVNYTVILQGFISAMKSGLKAVSNTQTVKNVTLDGKSQKANIVTIVLNKENKKIVTERAINNLKNNDSFLEEVSKLSNNTVDDLKTYFEEILKNIEYTDEAITMEIITDTKGTTLLGILLNSDKASMEFVSITNEMKLSLKEADKDVLNLTYTSKTNTTSTTKETSDKLELTSHINDQVLKVSLEGNVKDDIKPKVEKVNTKNSVNVNNISVEDQQKILNNVYNYGAIGTLIQSYLGDMLSTTDGSSDIPGNPNATVYSVTPASIQEPTAN